MSGDELEPLSRAAHRGNLRREMRAGFRRAIRLTALGTVVPGAGLTLTRHRKTGWLILIVALGSAALGAYVLLTQGVMKTALSVVTNATALQYAAIGLLASGAVWMVSIILTAVSSRPERLDRTRTRLLAVFTTIMVTLVAGGSYKVADYALITKDTLTDVFDAAPLKPGEGAPIVEGEDPWAQTPRVNLLLMGSDAGVGRTGTRPDSMIVASIDTQTGHTVLISMPRNLAYVPLPDASPLRGLYKRGIYGSPRCIREDADPEVEDPCLMNALWTEAKEYEAQHPGSYPDPHNAGRDETRAAIGEVLGLDIDHLVIIDLKGFQQLVDAMDGVDVNVRGGGASGTRPLPYGKKLRDGSYSHYFKPGMQHLDGYEALWYARTRAADDDFYRQARQRCVIKAIVGQVNPAQMLAKYADIAQILKDNIYTDIPGQNLAAYVELIERIQKSRISSLTLTRSQGIVPGDPDYALVRELVEKAISPPAPPTPTPTDATSTPTSEPSDGPTEPATKTPSSTTTTAAKPDPDAC